MGQKVHPYGLRLGINKTWKSNWFVNPKNYTQALHEDLQIKKTVLKSSEAEGADICDVQIARQAQKLTVFIHTPRPGVVIGANGKNIETLTVKLSKVTASEISIKIIEIKKPEANAQSIALNVAKQLEGRVAFRKALKTALTGAIKNGVQGIKIKISGRLGGVEMARNTQVKEGRVPLHTLRADIDFGFAEALTTYGQIGVKVWVFKGEQFKIVNPNIVRDDNRNNNKKPYSNDKSKGNNNRKYGNGGYKKNAESKELNNVKS